MTYQTINLEKKEGVATLTLNRPEVLNALDDQMAEELLDALHRIDKDKEIRVVVLTGAGRAFCSGADVHGRFSRLLQATRAGLESVEMLGPGSWREETCLTLHRLRPPTIAAINGAAVGFGMTLPLACDIRIASEKARLGFIFARVGYVPEFGCTYFLPRLVGAAKACELIFTGKIIDAAEAKEIGLVNQVVAVEEFPAATQELARSIAEGPAIALQLAKRGIYQGLNNDLMSQLQFEGFCTFAARHSQDHEEGLNAFLEKRKAVFKGK